jgi:hypothetical protein
MKEGFKQNAVGNTALIQIGELKDSAIFQVVSGIHSKEDLDAAIPTMHNIVWNLQKRKGSRDVRRPLFAMGTIFFLAAIYRSDIYSLSLAAIGFSALLAEQSLERYIGKIEIELTAANALLVDVYKEKMSHQIGANKSTIS